MFGMAVYPIKMPEQGFEFTSLDQSIKLQVPKPSTPEADLPRDALDKDWILFNLPKDTASPAIGLVTDLANDWQPLIHGFGQSVSSGAKCHSFEREIAGCAGRCDNRYCAHLLGSREGRKLPVPCLPDIVRHVRLAAPDHARWQSCCDRCAYRRERFIGSACSKQLSTRFRNYGVVADRERGANR